MRQLVWNRDYNVKPRELSAAQMRLTDIAVGLYWNNSDYRDIMRLLLTSVGRGGAGNIGQVNCIAPLFADISVSNIRNLLLLLLLF